MRSMLIGNDIPWLPILFGCGTLLQLCALWLPKERWLSRLLLIAGVALVCLCAARDRDITLAVGQIGILYVLWRMKFCTAKTRQVPPDA